MYFLLVDWLCLCKKEGVHERLVGSAERKQVTHLRRLVYEDQEHGLFTVTLFYKVVEEFRLHCRENK